MDMESFAMAGQCRSVNRKRRKSTRRGGEAQTRQKEKRANGIIAEYQAEMSLFRESLASKSLNNSSTNSSSLFTFDSTPIHVSFATNHETIIPIVRNYSEENTDDRYRYGTR